MLCPSYFFNRESIIKISIINGIVLTAGDTQPAWAAFSDANLGINRVAGEDIITVNTKSSCLTDILSLLAFIKVLLILS
jgi:hypothetical protein